MSKICGIYKITAPDGKIYIGQSIDIESRWQHYNWEYQINTRKTLIFESIKKHGSAAHKFEVLIECSRESLNVFERYYINKYDCVFPLGLNLTTGGTRAGEVTEETRAKHRASKLGNNYGKGNVGKIPSEAKRKKISDALMGKSYLTEISKKKISDKLKGIVRSEETKLKMSIAFKERPKHNRTGAKLTDEHKAILRARMSGPLNPNYGKYKK